ncbi:MAG: DUF1565 domain-containing protein [Planctomycetota bacterium]|nr:DUF1565 domain-containing protein [Planctomycetota bacterium]
MRPSLLVLALSLCLAACGGGSGGPEVPPSPYTLHVDATLGSDGNDGSVVAPFQTVTFALSQAQSGDSVKVMPGLYDSAHGETFPLKVPAGVELIGAPASRGSDPAATILFGSGPATDDFALNPNTKATVELGSGSRLVGLFVTNPDQVPGAAELGVAVTQTDVEIVSCTIRNTPGLGVATYLGAANVLVADSYFFNNGIGLHVRNGTTICVEQNYLATNQVGIATNWGIDMGGGAMGSVGGNTIALNVQADLQVLNGTGITVSAQNNAWDNVPPSEHVGATNPQDGRDVWIFNAADAVDTTGAQIAVPLP